jgi:predicted DCC family thiol-disulfide oxidoreductase YuxK
LCAKLIADRDELPDSIILRRADGALLFRSAAVLHLMSRLGGWWRVLAVAMVVIPAPIRDLVYRGVARVRSRLFAKPEGFCPIVPAHLRARFVS